MSGTEIGISSSCVLDAEGKIVGAMPEFARDPAILLRTLSRSGFDANLRHQGCRAATYGQVGHLCILTGTGGGCCGCRCRDGAKRRLCSELS